MKLSLANRVQQYQKNTMKFIMVAGARFGGKTGSLGTLPGKTLVIEITDKESGSAGAIAVAKENGNSLDVVTGVDCKDVLELVKEALPLYDNIAIDGFTALTEVEADKPSVKKMLNSNGNTVFVGWRLIGNEVVDLIQSLKNLSQEYAKPIIMTIALKEELDSNSNVVSTSADCKGNMAIGFIKGKCPFYVVARLVNDKDGNPIHILQTYDDQVYGARLDGVLGKDNPKGFRTERDKVSEGSNVGFTALFNFLEQYWSKEV